MNWALSRMTRDPTPNVATEARRLKLAAPRAYVAGLLLPAGVSDTGKPHAEVRQAAGRGLLLAVDRSEDRALLLGLRSR